MKFTLKAKELIDAALKLNECDALRIEIEEVAGGPAIQLELVPCEDGTVMHNIDDVSVVAIDEVLELLDDVIFDGENGELVIKQDGQGCGCGGHQSNGGGCGGHSHSGCGGHQEEKSSCGCGGHEEEKSSCGCGGHEEEHQCGCGSHDSEKETGKCCGGNELVDKNACGNSGENLADKDSCKGKSECGCGGHH